MGSLKCAIILVHAGNTKARQALTSMYESRLGQTEKCSFTLWQYGVEHTVAAFSGSPAPQANRWATAPVLKPPLKRQGVSAPFQLKRRKNNVPLRMLLSFSSTIVMVLFTTVASAFDFFTGCSCSSNILLDSARWEPCFCSCFPGSMHCMRFTTDAADFYFQRVAAVSIFIGIYLKQSTGPC